MRDLLEREGYATLSAADGEAGLARFRTGEADAIISDVNMPFLDGISLLRTVREEAPSLPFILLTSRDSEIDEVLGLDLGADDYITKPFSPRVLCSRLKVLFRRRQPEASPQGELIERDGLRIDTYRFEVSYEGSPIELTLSEHRLLACLVGAPGRAFSRQQLLDLAREESAGAVAPRIVDTYIARLRRKLEKAGGSKAMIETVVGVGYRFRSG